MVDNTRQTIEVVAEAEGYGARVEGEIESVMGVEDGIGSETGGEVHPVEVSAEIHRRDRRVLVRPRIGTAHGLYKAKPKLTPERVTELVDLHPIPMALHGGTGLTEDQFTDLIARGCAKVNISTALKIAFVDAHREYLRPGHPGKHDQPKLLAPVREAVRRWPHTTSGSSGPRVAPRPRRPRWGGEANPELTAPDVRPNPVDPVGLRRKKLDENPRRLYG